LLLALETWGAADAPPLLFAHGFGQTRHAWSSTAAALAGRGYRCITVDGRGHGESGWLEREPYTIAQYIADARELAASTRSRPVLVGASMGGLIGLLAEAEAATGLFRALVLVDITPRWEARGVERILAFMRSHPEGFASVEHAQSAIANYLPHRAQNREPNRLNKLLVRGADGRLRWHWDPRLLDTVAVEVAQTSAQLAEAARKLKLPVLLVSGGMSDVVSDATIAEFRALVPHAEHVEISDATHMVAGDSNARFTGEIAAFLNRLTHPQSGVFA
jgi:pimeloyl-ACP methyl ester carboxylesterase